MGYDPSIRVTVVTLECPKCPTWESEKKNSILAIQFAIFDHWLASHCIGLKSYSKYTINSLVVNKPNQPFGYLLPWHFCNVDALVRERLIVMTTVVTM